MTKRQKQQSAPPAVIAPRPSVVFSAPEAIDPTAWMTDY
ncbi:MAG: phage portal protein, partial [Aeromonas veronii]